jgi:hypothetical protein
MKGATGMIVGVAARPYLTFEVLLDRFQYRLEAITVNPRDAAERMIEGVDRKEYDSDDRR